jgi:hypothetical protein
MDLLGSEEALVSELPQSVNERGAFGAVFSIIAGIANGCAAPAFIQKQPEVPFLHDLIPPGIPNIRQICLPDDLLGIIYLIALGYIAPKGRIAVTDDQCIMLHFAFLQADHFAAPTAGRR